MSKRGTVSPLKKLISEGIEDLQRSGFPSDPRMNDAEEVSGPERFAKGQQKKDEVVIDTLLSSINGKTGYFLKLKKEVRPNEYMMMKVIETDWRKWADMEVEVSNIVKEHTKVAPLKWGTGPYRVEIACKTGMRGDTYDPIDFYINAEEEFMTPTAQQSGPMPVVNATEQLAATLDTVGNLMNALKNVMPQPATPIDPGKVQEQIAGAFEKGLQAKATEGSGNAAMMQAMMTGMIGMMTAMMQTRNDGPRVVNADPQDQLKGMMETLKTFGVLGNQNTTKEKSLVDLVTELKVLGVDVFKKDDPMESISKLKQMASIASDFMGMGGTSEKPSILEKIVDVLGPAIPKMITDIKEATQNTVRVQQIAGDNIRNATQKQLSNVPIQPVGNQPMGEPTTYQSMNSGKGNEPVNATVQNDQVKQFFNALYESVTTNNRMYYPVVYTSLLQDANGQALLQGIVSGSKNAKDLIDMLQEHGDERFKNSEFVMKSLVGYVNGFIVWIRQMMGQNQNSPEQQTLKKSNNLVGTASEGDTSQIKVNGTFEDYDAKCPICGTVYGFESEADFMMNSKVCEANGICVGILEPIK